jgi:serine protease Do
MSGISRFRFATAATVGFGVGVFFASSLDLTKLSWAQSGSPGANIQMRGPSTATDGTSSFADIAERVTPAVVSVRTTRAARQGARPQIRGRVPEGMEDFLEQFGAPQQRRQEGEGSGFIVRPDGYIVTNNHVVAGADQVTVVLSDRRTLRAKVVGTDSTTDVAVLKVEGSNFPTIGLGNDENTRIGDWVLAVGNPLGFDFTVTAGIVSAKGRGDEIQLPRAGGFAVSDFIQTDAAINPGNSGGPLINTRGEVIGMNSAIASNTGFYSGYGFAIPITLVRQVMEDLIKDGRVRLPVMGVLVQSVTADDAGVNKMTHIGGVKIGGFSPANAGPAKNAGMEIGDIIIAIDGKPIDRVGELQRIVRGYDIGDQVSVDVIRFGAKKVFKVKLVEAAPAEVASVGVDPRGPAPTLPANVTESSKLGVSVAPLTEEVARQFSMPTVRGVRVVTVSDIGPSYGKLTSNDVIVEVLHPTPRKISGTDDLQKALAGLKDGDYVSFLVQNPALDGQRVVNLRLGQ